MSWNNSARAARPRMLLAYADSAFASRCVRIFRRLGWEVHMAAGAAELPRLVDIHAPQVVVIDAALPEEAGWRASAQLSQSHPCPSVLLLAEARSSALMARAAAVGVAGVVARGDGVQALVQAVYGSSRARAM